MSVINLTKSSRLGKAQVSGSVAFVGDCGFDTTLSPTLAS